MTNKRISFEQKIEELLEKWSSIEFEKIEYTNKYTVSIVFNDCVDLKVGNDLWRTLTKLYNNYK